MVKTVMNDQKSDRENSAEIITEYEVIISDEHTIKYQNADYEREKVPDEWDHDNDDSSIHEETEEKREESEPEIWPEKFRAVQKKDRKNLVLLLILVLVFGLPTAGSVIGAGFSVLTGIISLVVSIFGGLIGLVFSAGAAGVALVGSGVGLIVSGALSIAVPATGVMMIGGGFLLLSASVLMFVLTGWGCGTVIPGFVRFCVKTVKNCCGMIKKAIRRIIGKGGAER